VRKNSVGWHGPGVVGIAILILIGVLASWWIGSALSGDEQHPVANGSMGMNAGEVAKTDSGMELPADFVSRLKTQAVQAPLASDGKQTLDLTIYGDTMSYMPANVKVKHGIPVRLNVNIGAGRDPG
jgi:hypothetical protein